MNKDQLLNIHSQRDKPRFRLVWAQTYHIQHISRKKEDTQGIHIVQAAIIKMNIHDTSNVLSYPFLLQKSQMNP